jgi:hypothetical protein
MRIVLIIIAIIAAGCALLSLPIAMAYQETLLMPFHAMVVCGIALAGLPSWRTPRKWVLASSLVLIVLPASWYFGMEAIPGGDDGIGLGWLFGAGGLAIVGVAGGLAGLITWIVAITTRRPSQSDTQA